MASDYAADDSNKDLFEAAGERGDELRVLDELICSTVPELAADRHSMQGMGFANVSYGMYHYRYSSGREGDWAAVSLANRKNYISLYVCAVADDGYLAEKYGKRLGKVDTGKSCIRFKTVGDLDLDEVRNILKDTQEWWRRQPKPQSTQPAREYDEDCNEEDAL